MEYDLLGVSSFFKIFFSCLFGQMESIDVAGVLQEPGDVDSRARTRSQM